jgi:hypothetical protein
MNISVVFIKPPAATTCLKRRVNDLAGNGAACGDTVYFFHDSVAEAAGPQKPNKDGHLKARD